MDNDEITFGHFRLDLRRRELSRDGEGHSYIVTVPGPRLSAGDRLAVGALGRTLIPNICRGYQEGSSSELISFSNSPGFGVRFGASRPRCRGA